MITITTDVEYGRGAEGWLDEEPKPTKCTVFVDPQRIRTLAALVRAHGLYKVEAFDSGIEWNEDIRTDMTTINVEEAEFWFEALIRHTGIEMRSARIPLAVLP